MRTLLLDSTFFPVKIINWQKAMVLMLTGRAEIVDEYPDTKIRSVSKSYVLPKILRLYSRHKTDKTVKFTRVNVFWRDEFRCQYCQIRLPMQKLTFDHVIPVSRGGETSWENVVTACGKCNSKKGNKLLRECGMKLHKEPLRPKWTPSLCLKIKEGDPMEWGQWVPEVKLG